LQQPFPVQKEVETRRSSTTESGPRDTLSQSQDEQTEGTISMPSPDSKIPLTPIHTPGKIKPFNSNSAENHFLNEKALLKDRKEILTSPGQRNEAQNDQNTETSYTPKLYSKKKKYIHSSSSNLQALIKDEKESIASPTEKDRSNKSKNEFSLYPSSRTSGEVEKKV